MKTKKELSVAYILLLLPAFFLGGLMVQNFYLNRKPMAFLQLGLWVAGWGSWVAAIVMTIATNNGVIGVPFYAFAMVLFLTLFILAVIDAVNLPKIVRQMNEG